MGNRLTEGVIIDDVHGAARCGDLMTKSHVFKTPSRNRRFSARFSLRRALCDKKFSRRGARLDRFCGFRHRSARKARVPSLDFSAVAMRASIKALLKPIL